ncbi:MAG: ABC transporter permease [Gemmatimonadaceae bacterium]|nr:ABC transporter permease [Gemmatimonadaceae bacterium]
MLALRRVVAALSRWLSRDRAERDLHDSVQNYAELLADEKVAAGVSPAEARRQALAELGGVESVKETVRQRRTGVLAEQMLQGFRHALMNTRYRFLGFSLSMSALLSATLGLNLIVFTFVNALWLRPLPFRDPDRVVTMLGSKYRSLDVPIFSTFEAVAGQGATDGLDGIQKPAVTLPQEGANFDVSGVTHAYFSLLGVPVRGRDFTASDDRVGAEPVAIISDRAWTRIFHGRDVIGSVIATAPKPLRVIGIAPPGFNGARRGESTDVWIPSALVLGLAGNAPRFVTMDVIARLRPGDTVSDANQRLRVAGGPRSAQFVLLSRVFGGPESAKVVIQDGGSFGVVGGLALLVLCGGCAALAALLLVHYERRRLEFAIRGALGASRDQLVVGLVGELGVSAVLGVLGALGLTWLGIRAMPHSARRP